MSAEGLYSLVYKLGHIVLLVQGYSVTGHKLGVLLLNIRFASGKLEPWVSLRHFRKMAYVGGLLVDHGEPWQICADVGRHNYLEGKCSRDASI
jgi:hypothetical protein